MIVNKIDKNLEILFTYANLKTNYRLIRFVSIIRVWCGCIEIGVTKIFIFILCEFNGG